MQRRMIGSKTRPMTRRRSGLMAGARRKPLSARKERLIGELLPRLRLDLAHAAAAPLDRALRGRRSRRSGWRSASARGEHLFWQAEHHREIGFIGCEPFINGMASLLGAIEERGLATIRVHDGDARHVLAWLPDALDRRGLPAVSRSLAEKAAAEAAASLAGTVQRAGARAAPRRRAQICL